MKQNVIQHSIQSTNALEVVLGGFEPPTSVLQTYAIPTATAPDYLSFTNIYQSFSAKQKAGFTSP